MSENVEEFIEYDFEEITPDQIVCEGIEVIEDLTDNGGEIVEEFLPQDDESTQYLDDPNSVMEDVEEISANGELFITNENESVDAYVSQQQQQQRQQTQKRVSRIGRPLNAKNNKGPRKFLLYDMLIAEIVDYDQEDGAPIVEFSMSKYDRDYKKLPVECGICPDVMPRNELNEHLKTHLKPGTKRFNCIYCDENFVSRSYAAGHARRHMGIRPYVCTECKLYYCTKQDLKVHEQRRHLTKEHICEHCGKTFAQNTTLRSHVMLVHEQQRRFECEYCGKKFLRNYTKVKHVQNVHLGNRTLFDCPFCDKRFKDTHKLADHRKKYHLSTQTRFDCRECGLEFTSIDFFDAHRRSLQCRQKYKERYQTQDRPENNNQQSEPELHQLQEIARQQEHLQQKEVQQSEESSNGEQMHQISMENEEEQTMHEHEHSQNDIIEPHHYVVEIPAGVHPQQIVHIQPGQQFVITADGTIKQEEDFLYEITVDS